ncbi:MAG: hypothetical protein HWE39_20995 [Oceanospirillaceae bacterium]|nr:hypothetical protein [Oceanospirillaceae bacterium]
MKILYGVQATGNGHITRARVMEPALAAAGVDVDYLFSGRDPAALFNMEPFGDFRCRRGLTFSYQPGGRIDVPGTLLGNSLWQLWREIRELDLSGYDLVISDFEPVTARAARKRGLPSLGIAHQYVFNHRLPGHHQGWGTRAAIRAFAPVDLAVGLHWHHFGQPILPPLISPPRYPVSLEADKILVYLPYEPQDELLRWFRPFSDYRFVVYCALKEGRVIENVDFRPFSRDGFEQDLASCAGVISNSGFGLSSETVQYGKKLLSKPYLGQVEQLSNAELMTRLGMATVMQQQFEPRQLADWLRLPNPEPAPYPDVAGSLARWIAGGQRETVDELARQLWDEYGEPAVAG